MSTKLPHEAAVTFCARDAAHKVRAFSYNAVPVSHKNYFAALRVTWTEKEEKVFYVEGPNTLTSKFILIATANYRVKIPMSLTMQRPPHSVGRVGAYTDAALP